MMFLAAFMGFNCPACGPISRDRFPRETRRKILWGSVGMGCGALTLIGVFILGMAIYDLKKKTPAFFYTPPNRVFTLQFPAGYGDPKVETENTTSGPTGSDSYFSQAKSGASVLGVVVYTLPEKAFMYETKGFLESACKTTLKPLTKKNPEITYTTFKGLPACFMDFQQDIDPGDKGDPRNKVWLVLKKPHLFVFHGIFDMTNKSADPGDMQKLMDSVELR